MLKDTKKGIQYVQIIKILTPNEQNWTNKWETKSFAGDDLNSNDQISDAKGKQTLKEVSYH